MKKIGLIVKEAAENRIVNKLQESDTVLIIKYSGISSMDITSLRQGLKQVQANLFVVQNGTARRALKSIGREELIPRIEGPSGLVFVKEEPVGACKFLCDFLKTHEQLKIEGGFLQDKLLEKQDVEALAKLPGKDVLRAQVVMTLNSPIRGMVSTLNGILRKFVYCLDQVKQKKASTGDTGK